MGLFSKREQESVAELIHAISKSPRALAALPPGTVGDFKLLVRRLNEPITVRAPKLPLRSGRRVDKDQFGINYSFVQRGTRRADRKWRKYPIEMVEDARSMRENGYTYVEIAAALRREYKIAVPWITVRDWTNFYYRVKR